MQVLLTRPLAQVKALSQQLLENGDTPLLFPSLKIQALVPNLLPKSFDVLIFISTNALHYAQPYLDQLINAQVSIVAIGKATCIALEKYGLTADICPKKEASSQALLAHPAVRAMTNKKILIVRGLGGLETLKEQLLKQGNQVDYLEVYQRVVEDLSAQHRQSLVQFLRKKQGVLTIHSIDSLDAFYQLVGEIDDKAFVRLLAYPLVLFSQRIKPCANAYGFQHCYIAKTTDNQGLLAALKLAKTFIKASH